MRAILGLPLILILTGIGALAMAVPAVYGHLHDEHRAARAFAYAGAGTLLLVVMAAIATAAARPRNVPRRHLAMVAATYVVLPGVFAVPFAQAVADTTFANAWFEMVSCFTTTGATLYEAPGRLTPTLHLWRGLVGWMGGLFILIAVAAILAPLDLGGLEVASGRAPGRGAARGALPPRPEDHGARLVRQTLMVAPVYGGLTVALWVGLLIAGETGLPALMLAMAAVSTSGIVAGAGAGLHHSAAGLAGEAMVFVVLLAALSRRSLPGAVRAGPSPALLRDPELRLAAAFLIAVPAVLFLRHWAGAWEGDRESDLAAGALAFWGALFTTLSFLTTTGLESAGWQAARAWSGLGTPGLILLGLAMMGGGIATTAGGLKLLRVYALILHGAREMDRLVHPSAVAGGGEAQRRLRDQGAYAAWIFFMLFALTLTVGVAALALTRQSFEASVVLAVAALTTTGPLATLAAETPIVLADLPGAAKAILAGLMVLGRVEVLAILALVVPAAWRR